MRSKFYLFLLVPVLILTACKKWVPENDTNRIVGNWQIVSVVRNGSFGTEPVQTGYENGTFYFNHNGNARFSDNIGDMEGTWRMIRRSDAYDGATNSLELRLYDYYNNDAIEWEFHSVEFNSSGNRMMGYMNRYGYEYRYEFRRY